MNEPMVIAERLDHIVTLFDSKSDCQAAYQFFANTLRLPVLWPLSSYPNQRFNPLIYYDALVFCGNVAFELFHLPIQGWLRRLFYKKPAAFVGLAYVPVDLNKARHILDKRGFQHTIALPNYMNMTQLAPEVIDFLDTGEGIFSTESLNRTIQEVPEALKEKYQAFNEPAIKNKDKILPFRFLFFELSTCRTLEKLQKWLRGSETFEGLHGFGHLMDPDSMTLFLVEFNPRSSEFPEVIERKRHAFEESGGGPLGIKGLSEVLFQAENKEKISEELSQFFSAGQEKANIWKGSAPEDPVLTLIEGHSNHIHGVKFKVYDLAEAKSYLKRENIEFKDTKQGTQIMANALKGLQVFMDE